MGTARREGSCTVRVTGDQKRAPKGIQPGGGPDGLMEDRFENDMGTIGDHKEGYERPVVSCGEHALWPPMYSLPGRQKNDVAMMEQSAYGATG
jgi:hypothetical protein